MAKPILLVSVPVTDTELETIEKGAHGYRVIKEGDFNSSFEEVEILYGWPDELGDSFLSSKTTNVKWLQAESAGVNHLDNNWIMKNNILLSNASGIHGNQMSESILGMIFAHTRQIKSSILNQTDKKWEQGLPSTDLVGKKVMIVGTGSIGQRLAELMTVFGAETIGVNRSGKPIDYFNRTLRQEEIHQEIAQMDIVISLLPATKETHYFFSDTLISEMKNGVIFINAGRGVTVDTNALVKHCQSGKISFAGLDVFEEEPLTKTSPLWELDNVLITPHISGGSDQYYRRLFPLFMTNLTSYLTTKTLSQNNINLEEG